MIGNNNNSSQQRNDGSNAMANVMGQMGNQ
jgi:hypothetical protein